MTPNPPTPAPVWKTPQCDALDLELFNLGSPEGSSPCREAMKLARTLERKLTAKDAEIAQFRARYKFLHKCYDFACDTFTPDEIARKMAERDNLQLKPEDTTIVAKREPVVTKRDDGTWAITFPKDGLKVEWKGPIVLSRETLRINYTEGVKPSNLITVEPTTKIQMPVSVPEIELGLRSDGTVVWREVKP